jgi:hypothetical protein
VSTEAVVSACALWFTLGVLVGMRVNDRMWRRLLW